MNRLWSTIATTAAFAVVLLAVCFSVPGPMKHLLLQGGAKAPQICYAGQSVSDVLLAHPIVSLVTPLLILAIGWRFGKLGLTAWVVNAAMFLGILTMLAGLYLAFNPM